jgi:acetyl/propionyl-CoA carboxylase alpha subunit
VTRFVVGEQEHVGLVQANGDGRTRVRVDGVEVDLEVKRLGPGAFAWRHDDGRLEIFHCVRDGRVIHLSWRGVTYRIEEREEGGSAHARPTHGGLEAPMPGKVVALRVGVGQRVAKGAEVLVVEAMKMENALRAPRDGVVKAVHVKEGDAVVPGVVLVELE